MRQQEDPNRSEENDAQSYDQSDQSELSPAFHRPLVLPRKEIALTYLDTYFSTIHIAYPFLCKSTVLYHFDRLWKGDANEAADRVWLA